MAGAGCGDGQIEVRFDPVVPGISKVWVRKIVRSVLWRERSRRTSVSVFLTDDRRIRSLNKQFLERDRVTDVIAFWSHGDHLVGREAGYLGDVAVSTGRARIMSEKLGHAFKEELARYLIHGVLHLLGYTDKNDRQRRRMFKRQEALIRLVFSKSETR